MPTRTAPSPYATNGSVVSTGNPHSILRLYGGPPTAGEGPGGDLDRAEIRVRRPDQSSARRLLHKRADLCLFGVGQLLQGEGGWPHGAFVEVRCFLEAERRIPRVELLRAL